MDYLRAYSFSADETILAAWESQVALAAEISFFKNLLLHPELFTHFAESYTRLRGLPRGNRRELQRNLATSSVFAIPHDARRKFAQSIAGAALLIALAQGADAATIKVTTNIPDINNGDGKCSLIEAIVNANAGASTHPDCAAGDAGPNTIVLPKKSTQLLTSPVPGYYDDAGLPTITSRLTIEGRGSKIARSISAPPFRLLEVAFAGEVTLRRVKLSGGLSSDEGGGILKAYGAVLTLDRSTVSENTSYRRGGGIFSRGGGLTITGSTISGNVATGFGALGGGIYAEYGATIVDSEISGNAAFAPGRYARGGGIYARHGYITIDRTTISGNTARGGIDAGGAGFSGGACLTLTNSTVSGNSAIADSTFGAGVLGRGFDPYLCDLTIERSTISGNSAHSYFIARGGGVYGGGKIIDSTISGNSLDAFFAAGGGVSNALTLTIDNSTITGNTALYGRGGGVQSNFYVRRLYLHRNLISGNSAASGVELDNTGSYVYADDYNLFGADGDPGVYGFSPGSSDIVPYVPVNQIVGPLKNNGGPTQTHALVKGSPAIDAIPFSDPNCIGTDQRGVARPRGAGCDIGAFER